MGDPPTATHNIMQIYGNHVGILRLWAAYLDVEIDSYQRQIVIAGIIRRVHRYGPTVLTVEDLGLLFQPISDGLSRDVRITMSPTRQEIESAFEDWRSLHEHQ